VAETLTYAPSVLSPCWPTHTQAHLGKSHVPLPGCRLSGLASYHGYFGFRALVQTRFNSMKQLLPALQSTSANFGQDVNCVVLKKNLAS
jgi:hypothetical protein